ncbi:MAG: DUF6575 domain-containing protein [Microcoleus sp.]
MEPLIGFKLNKFPLNLKRIADLEYFDGPLLSLFENEYGDSYLYSWCDADNLYNRWLVFRIVRSTLKLYIECNISLHELIVNPADGFIYSLDIDNTLQVKNTYLLLPENLPTIYLPETDSYYELSELNPETAEADRLLIYQKIYDESQLSKV